MSEHLIIEVTDEMVDRIAWYTFGAIVNDSDPVSLIRFLMADYSHKLASIIFAAVNVVLLYNGVLLPRDNEFDSKAEHKQWFDEQLAPLLDASTKRFDEILNGAVAKIL